MTHAERATKVITRLFPSERFKLMVGSSQDHSKEYSKDETVVIFWDDTWVGYLHMNKDTGIIEEFQQNDHICLCLPDILYIAEITSGYNAGIMEELNEKTSG